MTQANDGRDFEAAVNLLETFNVIQVTSWPTVFAIPVLAVSIQSSVEEAIRSRLSVEEESAVLRAMEKTHRELIRQEGA